MGNQRFELEGKIFGRNWHVLQINHCILNFLSSIFNVAGITCSFVNEEKKFWSSSLLSRSERLIILSISAFMIYLHEDKSQNSNHVAH